MGRLSLNFVLPPRAKIIKENLKAGTCSVAQGVASDLTLKLERGLS